jgi:osmotically-inducible protein OsmY
MHMKLLIPAMLAIATVANGQMIVEEQRLRSDADIQARVMDRLAGLPRVEGQIGVESHNAVVTLTGWTRTSAQAWRVEFAARGVDGVAGVQNQIRSRMSV